MELAYSGAETGLRALKEFVKGIGVLVTASTSGIGLGIARTLAAWGARVVVSSRSLERARKVAETVAAETGGEVYSVELNLLLEQSIREGFNRAWRLLDGIDLLVVNTGNIGCEPCMLHEASYNDWAEAAKMYVAGPGFLTSLYISRLLDEKRRGVIVYLSSISVKEPMRFIGLADTARAGLSQLARLVSRVYGGNGIRAYTVLLGSFDTPGARRLIAKIAERLGVSPGQLWEKEVVGRTPLKRTGGFEELAALIAYLASPYAEYMAGSTIEFSGSMVRCV